MTKDLTPILSVTQDSLGRNPLLEEKKRLLCPCDSLNEGEGMLTGKRE